ncbi:DUF2218 domain-containing protein [Stackebrandtia nassauensis]|uniref:Cytosolic protein n=1 Tax=Stackebrandtia nassauensis (strain DSM 44728 / CIP 108903 / NRRL B-16338 / NBRC 102104 / LLR-40K-21) TaxID=446470 RepID=D3Q5A5_STANL|nr:DUF2218 domain-containing protein [Stackebrandtia nassauensis]ADD44154.1 cytosolic protein [Stackebrandtia nassauensis DSM 44728]
MPAAHARVATPRAARYLKQLSSHFGHKADSTYDEHSGHTDFGFGQCRMTAETDALVIDVEAPDAEMLGRVEHVVADHLERFASREGLSVEWRPAS